MIQLVCYTRTQGSIKNHAITQPGKMNTNSSDRNITCHYYGDHDPNIPIITHKMLQFIIDLNIVRVNTIRTSFTQILNIYHTHSFIDGITSSYAVSIFVDNS